MTTTETNQRSPWLLPILAIALLLNGCSGGPTTPVRYFLIDPVPLQALQPTETSGLAIEILDLQLPQYLDRPHIVSRSGDNELLFSSTHQWAGNLRKNLAGTLQRNLSQLLATADISSPYARSGSHPDFRVILHLHAFERGADHRARIEARWQIADARNGQIV